MYLVVCQWASSRIVSNSCLAAIRSDIGDAGATALAQAIKPVSEGGSGALAKCQNLFLNWNQIGDAGVTALVSACASGALDDLQDLYLNGHSFSLDAKHIMKTAMAKRGGRVHF